MSNGDLEDARKLAVSLRRLLDDAWQIIDENKEPSRLVRRITDHLGIPLEDVVVVAQNWATWEHASVQRGLDAYLGPEPDWFGIAGEQIHDELINVLRSQHNRVDLGKATIGTAAIGPAENTEVVSLGLVTTRSPDGKPVVIAVHASDRYGPPRLYLNVFAADAATGAAVRDEVERLANENSVFRGQVLSFGHSEHYGNELVSFLPRPALTGEEVILPAGVLEMIEQHVIDVADWSQELLAAGQHLKRGLLLHGPPGTGKTHTVRYLMSRLTRCTVVVLTGRAMGFIETAAALARRLQPSVVVLEDVDLVASDREFSPDGNPLLFQLLDAMDGVGADVDVTFVLTTNRADLLEEALRDRPGRVDLAIEIPRPDAEGRARLLDLYTRGLEMNASPEPIVEGTEGVTASFIKELVRRSVLNALRENRTSVLEDRHVATALSEMTEARQQLTRVLLGAGAEEEGPPRARQGARIRPASPSLAPPTDGVAQVWPE